MLLLQAQHDASTVLGGLQGFLLKAVSSNHTPEHSFERETIAITDCAGSLFSLGIRLFLAFSLAVRREPPAVPAARVQGCFL